MTPGQPALTRRRFVQRSVATVGAILACPTKTRKIDGNQDHTRNFLHCVRTRSRSNADVEIGCRSVTVCHLSNLAYQLQRPLQWNPDREAFANDSEWNGFLDHAHREP